VAATENPSNREIKASLGLCQLPNILKGRYIKVMPRFTRLERTNFRRKPIVESSYVVLQISATPTERIKNRSIALS